MTREEIEKLAVKYQKKADKDFRNYQDSGMSRFLSSYHRNEELATALRIAAQSADEHQAYISMKSSMSEFTSRAQRITYVQNEDNKGQLTQALIQDLIQYGRFKGLIRE